MCKLRNQRWAWMLLWLAMTCNAHAFVSAISRGTAGAGRAAVESSDVAFQNPASIAYVRGYHFTTGISRLSSPLGVDQEELAVLLSDNFKETVVPTALGFVQKRDLGTDEGYVQRDIRLAVGNILYESTALGFGLTYRQERSSLLNTQQLSMVIGSMIALTKSLGLALVLENALPITTAPEAREKLTPLTGLGLSYNLGKFLRTRLDFTSDSSNSWNRPSVAVGVENYWNRWLIFRLGAARDAELEQTLTAVGFGFAGPRFGIHYAFQSVEMADGRDQRHSIDLGFPLW